MSDVKKPRVMTAKRFATAKLSGRTTAEGFLAAHMAFLRAHNFLDPILDAYQGEVLLPTPTLQAVQSALLTHVLESERKTQEAKMAQRKDAAKPKAHKPKGEGKEVQAAPYSITLMCKFFKDKSLTDFDIRVGEVEEITGYKIRNAKGEAVIVDTKDEADGRVILETLRETHPAVWDAEDFGAAMRLADRRLFQREDSVYAVIRNNFDRPVDTNIQRGDAIARILAKKSGPTSRNRGTSTKSLGFGVHAKPTRVVGPWTGR